MAAGSRCPSALLATDTAMELSPGSFAVQLMVAHFAPMMPLSLTTVQVPLSGGAIKVLPHQQPDPAIDREERLQLFDQATKRQQRRDARRIIATPPKDRGWTREELHDRDGTR